MHLFYTPEIKGESYILNEEESKHCLKVLRLSINDSIHLTDGKGNLYTAIIVSDHPKKCEVKIVSSLSNYGKRNFRVHIAVAPTKNSDRLEWFLEKSTEIGIDEISPILSSRSERTNINIERLNKVITAAVKQSLKAYHPKLNTAYKYKDFIEQSFQGLKFIAHCNDGIKKSLSSSVEIGNDVLILIGPEGDFTTAEVNQAIENGFVPISLGMSRLRTETAALVACHTINLINNV